MPLRMVIASLGPMPLTVISFSKSCFSSGRRNPYSAKASSRTWVWMCSATSAPVAGKIGKSGHGNDNVVAHAAGLNNGLVGMFGDEASAQVSNHERQWSVVSCRWFKVFITGRSPLRFFVLTDNLATGN